MVNPTLKTIPAGEIQLFDRYVPALPGGNWRIEVTHTLTHDSAPLTQDAIGARQQFTVVAPQFTISADEILQQYPPPNSSGQFHQVLPHIVFKEALLPWERTLKNSAPWLALLVFDDVELPGGNDHPERRRFTTVQEFLKADNQVLKPAIAMEQDVDPSSTCSYIQLPVSAFQQLAPRLSELRYLAHCRQANLGDKVLSSGTDPNGLYSLLVANRFPAAGPSADVPAKNIIHLVSLEGLENYLVDQPNFGSYTSLALVSLASWSFFCLPNPLEDFRGLMEGLVQSEKEPNGLFDAGRLWLRLPPLESTATDDVAKSAQQRLQDGYVPLAYHLRTGEDSWAWYRGPLTPTLPARLEKHAPFPTADAALIYDEKNGLFDTSLAAAWESGRSLALADASFCAALLSLRRKLASRLNQLGYMKHSRCFANQSLTSETPFIQEDFIQSLDSAFLATIGAQAIDKTMTSPLAQSKTRVSSLSAHLQDGRIQDQLKALAMDIADPVVQWLARLSLLYPIPFDQLVPDARMLPVESLRFFYVDQNWLDAAVEGALSVGITSSMDVQVHQVIKNSLHQAAELTSRKWRARLLNTPDAPTADSDQPCCGFLLRSAVVSGWPNLAIRPYTADHGHLPIVRMDHLAPNLLLCIFLGIPAYVDFCEPQESFRFGVDDNWNVLLRNLKPPASSGDLPLGAQLPGDPLFCLTSADHAQVLRTPGSRVLQLAPDKAAGLVMSLRSAMEKAMNSSLNSFGPADFALQMIKSPEAVRFTSKLT